MIARVTDVATIPGDAVRPDLAERHQTGLTPFPSHGFAIPAVIMP